MSTSYSKTLDNALRVTSPPLVSVSFKISLSETNKAPAVVVNNRQWSLDFGIRYALSTYRDLNAYHL